MAVDDPLKRQFYLEMCAHEHWSTRELDVKIDGMLFERTEGNTEHIEYLMLDEDKIRVAQYFKDLPSKSVLKRKLQRAIALAQAQIAERTSVK